MTACYQDGQPDGSYGALDPTRDELYQFIETLFGEVTTVFPDDHFHIGGDEVQFGCW